MSRVIDSTFPVSYIMNGDERLNNWNKEGWYMIINENIYTIPHPTQIDKVSLVQSQYLEGLLYNREKLFEQIFSMINYDEDFVENLNYLIMKN